MYEFNQQPSHVLSPDAHLPLDIPFIREPVELSTWNNIPPSYIPYIGEMEATSDDSSVEEEMVEQVLHPNLPPQIFMDDATVIIDSLPPVEEISNFEPNYSEMYHFDKNPVHTLSPSYHLPLDIPFIRESIETAVAQGKTPSYIPLDPRRPSIISIHQDEMVGEVLEAIPTTGLPPDKWISPEPQQLPTYEINMDDLYKFDRHGLHDLSPTTNELPVDCPFIRNPVEIDLQRSRAPSYIPYEKDLALSDHREEDRLVKEVLDVKVLSLSELLHESSQDLMGMVTVVQEKKEKEWFDGVPSTFKRQSLDKGSTGYIVERHHEGNDVIHSMSPSYHLPLDYPFIPVVNETNAEHLPAGAPVGTGIQIGGYPTN
uniref:Uncharacterized protein n=1 Tax=Panagrolaimus superbus TaxID=310955 RepID=A0A914Y0K8_9BILA